MLGSALQHFDSTEYSNQNTIDKVLSIHQKIEDKRNRDHKIYTYQERCEDSEEGSKAKNNRISNALIEHCVPFKEAALPPTAISRHDVVVLAGKVERRTL